MEAKEKIAYLKGLIEGLKIEDENQKKIYGAIIEILESLDNDIDFLSDEIEELDEITEILDNDLGELEDLAYGDEPDEEDFYTEICPVCGSAMELEDDDLLSGSAVCPECGEKFMLSDCDCGCESCDCE